MTLLCPNGHDVKLNNEVTGAHQLKERLAWGESYVESGLVFTAEDDPQVPESVKGTRRISSVRGIV
jgi:hypothetical protein